MQLKALHLGAMALACAVLLAAALPAPHAAAQATGDPTVSSEQEAAQVRIQRAVLNIVMFLGDEREREVRDLRWRYRSGLSREYLDSQIAWIEGIEQGDPRIMFETALRLRDGDGLPQDRRAAKTWFERAGDHGVPEGYYASARMRLDNPDGDGDLLIGGMTLNRAAYMGVTAAQKDWGMREIAGVPLDGSYYHGYAWLLLARANGAEVDDAAIANAGEHLTEEDREHARRRVEKATGKVRLPRIWPLGDEFDESELWQAEVRSALNWEECGRALSALDAGRQAGDPVAEHRTAEFYEEGTCVDRDDAKAFEHYSTAVDGGNLVSAFRLSLLYYDGRGTGKDLEAAQHWFKAAALSMVASSYERGERLRWASGHMPRGFFLQRDLPPELIDEIEWLAEIEDGDPRILHETALRVRDGDGLPRDSEAAERWLVKAGRRGVPEAFYDLGLTFLNTPIYSRDEEFGIRYLGAAGRDGYLPAQVELGRRYAAGDQVQQRDHAAYVWLLIADENGGDVAALLEQVGKRLSGEEREAARAEAEKGANFPRHLR